MEISKYMNQIYESLSKGAFLTTKDEKVNSMTVSWGLIGIEWGTPVMTVMVRESRFSKDALDKNNEFTLTLPIPGEMAEELGFCGSKSGRDFDKIAECNLSLVNSDIIDTPIVYAKGLALECKVLYKEEINSANMCCAVKNKWYASNDYHTYYHAQIVNIKEL